MDFTSHNRKLNCIIYIFVGGILAVYAGLRDGDYVTDYKSYQWMYDNELYIVEPTFTIICYIVRHLLGDNIVWLFVIYALIGIWIKLLAIRQLSQLILFSLLIYVSDFFLVQEMTQIRVAVSTGIMLLALPSFYEHNGKRFFLLFIIAIFFHISSIIMIIVWFLNPKQLNKYFWLTILLGGYILAFMKIDVISLVSYIPLNAIQQKYEMYRLQQESGDFSVNVFSLMFLVKLFLTLLLTWKIEVLITYNKYSYLLLKIMFISLISLLLFSQNLAAGLRISEFFGVVSIILFPMLYYIIRPRWFAWITIIIVALGFVWVRIFSIHLISFEPL